MNRWMHPGGIAIAALVLGTVGCRPGDTPPFSDQGVGALAEVMRPRGTTKEVAFTTDEGTWMSVDVSPDGAWIAFDLLGHIYRVPIEGGDAQALTQGSGVALNFHPAFSPDGSKIAFVSDRSGQNNVWVMDADGGNPTAALLDGGTRFTDPEWRVDGQALVAVRIYPTPGRGWHRRTMTLWELPLDGEAPGVVREGRGAHFTSPSFGPDGSLYYQAAYSTWFGKGMLKAGHRIQRIDPGSGEAVNVRLPLPPDPTPDYQAALDRTLWAEDVEGDEPATLAPEVSPDGRYLAFAQEVSGDAYRAKGHEYHPRTVLFVRDLQSGVERAVLDPAPKDLTRTNAQYSYRVFPGYSWTPDSRSLVLGHEGKIRRVDVETGAVEAIPFRAHVRRELSEQVRGRVEVGSDVSIRFPQWPAGAPAGPGLALVAAGRIWLAEDRAGPFAPLTDSMLPHFQLAPAWSPGADRIAFATWHDVEGGALWTVDRSGSDLRRVTPGRDAYHHPVWAPDERALYAVRHGVSLAGDRVLTDRSVWDRTTGWVLVRVSLDDGAETVLADVGAPTAPNLGADGRIRFTRQDDPAAAAELYQPFPPETATEQTVVLWSVEPDGTDPRRHAELPATMGRTGGLGGRNQARLSADGRRLAFQSDQLVFIQDLDPEAPAPRVETDPNVDVPGRIRLGRVGGAFPRWRGEETLEFVSGPRYVTYHLAEGTLNATDLALRIPRPTPSGGAVLSGARIVTLDGDLVIESGDVVVEGSRITCVGACPADPEHRVFDLSGRTIIPGLVNLHAHHTTEISGVVPQHRPQSALPLAYGVTTVVDPATDDYSAFALGEMIDAGVVVGPRTYSAGGLLITSGRAWGPRWEADSPAAAVYQVERRKDWGAITIKNYRQARRAQHQRIIQAARSRNISVTSEGGPLYFDVGLAMDGQTGWEHFIAKLPLYSDATTFFGLAGIHYSPTVIVAGHVDGAMEYYRPRQGLMDDPKYTRFMPLRSLRAMHAGMRDLEKREFSFPMVAQGLADIVRAGGYGAIGEHGNQPGMGEHWELWAYAEALTPLEALRVGSLHGAHFVGLEGELGSIEVGKLADLVILGSNPLEDIRNSADVEMVMKGGFLYEGETLDRMWPDTAAYGPVPWRVTWP